MLINPLSTKPKQKKKLQYAFKYLDSRANNTTFKRSDINNMVSSTPLQKCHAVMTAIRHSLSKFDTGKIRRSKDQCKMQEVCMSGICTLVYGDLVKTHKRQIMKYNQFESLEPLILNTMPRRGGKTTWLAQFIAAVLVNVPGADIVVVASNKRAVGSESGITKKVLENLDILGIKKFDKHTSEAVFITVNGDKRLYHSYPGGATHK
jgi:hypothetical protein